MNTAAVYSLHWKSMPLGAIQDYGDWYDSYLGAGVYMFVVARMDGGYTGFYIGQSRDIGRRWREHVKEWFLDPPPTHWIADSADDFLKDPAVVFNSELGRIHNPNRKEIQSRVLSQTWLAFAEVDDHERISLLDDIEYVLQEGLKKHIGIKRGGHVGDSHNRRHPTNSYVIHNHFGRPFLNPTLPGEIRFAPDRGVSVVRESISE